MLQMNINGLPCNVLVDTGCTTSIAHVSVCSNCSTKSTSVTTISGEQLQCIGMGIVQVCLLSGASAAVDVLVVKEPPLGFKFILGMNGITAFHGVTVRSQNEVSFGVEQNACVVGRKPEPEMYVFDAKDFTVRYNHDSREWTVVWKWNEGVEPVYLPNTVAEYRIPSEVRSEYEAEINKWISDGWLVPYSENQHGRAVGTVPLLAVIQHNKNKVRPVLDFRNLNTHLNPHTADADVCLNTIREWRRQGKRIAVIDLCKAYLQIHVDKSLWKYQTVVFQGKRYCLTRLGFGISIAPLVMKTIISNVLSFDRTIFEAASPYLDDILVNESKVSAETVIEHLACYGLSCKPVDRVGSGTRLLGMHVWKESSGLFWKRENQIPVMQQRLTRRDVFSICGQLTSHLPVCGWLRVAASYIKRRANAATTSWDESIEDSAIFTMLGETLQKIRSSDPAHGRWDVEGESAVLWVDASSLAIGVVLQVNDETVEDASWLRKEDCSHINMAELDAVLKGVNLAITWKMKRIKVMSDSRSVFHWIQNALSGKSRLKTKSSSEMLIRRRLETLMQIVDDYKLQLDVKFVRSEENKADALTRVPQRWLTMVKEGQICGAVRTEDIPASEIIRIHEISGHPGIKRTLYFCRRAHPDVTRAQVRNVVLSCRKCQSIDPAPERWERGSLSVNECWKRISSDICHVNGQHYLTLIDCGPSRFTIWRHLKRQDAFAIIEQLEQIFYERGAPTQLLTDNATIFHSTPFRKFTDHWAIEVLYRCAHVPSGNGISERSHRTIKTIVARSNCSVSEAVYRYNVTPHSGNSKTPPSDHIHNYKFRVIGVDTVNHQTKSPVGSQFCIGDQVWVKHPSRRCDAPSSIGTVTGRNSVQNIEVDGVPRHVRDLRLVRQQSRVPPFPNNETISDNDECVLRFGGTPTEAQSSESCSADGTMDRSVPRRGSRERRQLVPFQYSDLL